MKYAPGEWKYNGRYIDSTEGNRIAEIYNHAPGYTANAHLIAAAPTMLETLNILSCLKVLKEEHPTTYKSVLEVIAKAEGQ